MLNLQFTFNVTNIARCPVLCDIGGLVFGLEWRGALLLHHVHAFPCYQINVSSLLDICIIKLSRTHYKVTINQHLHLY